LDFYSASSPKHQSEDRHFTSLRHIILIPDHGVPGDKGVSGTPGEQGALGETGSPGPVGPRGVNGDNGKPGAKGPQGWYLFINSVYYVKND
jgi:hypothetical protein